jgi:cytoskeletal protein CcmA (bactofilin family)
MSAISKGLKFKGEIHGSEDLRIDGSVEGRLNLTAGVVVGPGGQVMGDIEAREVVVEGTVRGNVTARERVRIAASGRVEGDVTAGRLAVEEGAQISGRVQIAASTPAAAASRIASRP